MGFIISFSMFNRMGLWRTLCLQSNIEEVLSVSFCIPISSLFWNMKIFLVFILSHSFLVFFVLYLHILQRFSLLHYELTFIFLFYIVNNPVFFKRFLHLFSVFCLHHL